MAPKKGKKVNLSEFLADDSIGGSWADEMDSLPTGPSGDPSAGGLGGSNLTQGGGRGGYGDRANRGPDSYQSDRPARQEVPLPTSPPYTAFVGNLTFETIEMDLQNFFTGLPTVSIRIVTDQMEKKPKGFGYVEFTTLQSLTTALTLNGSDLSGRAVRISVAEAPKNREGRADEDISWVRQGPLAPLAGRDGGRSGGFGGNGNGRERDAGFGSSAGLERGEEVVRDGPIRGGKFVASAAGESSSNNNRRPSGFDRNVSGNGAGGGFGRDRDSSSSGPPPMVEEVVRDGPIRGGKFVPTPERASFSNNNNNNNNNDRRTSGPLGNSTNGGFTPGAGIQEPSRADEEKTWSRNGPLPPVASAARSSSFGGARTPPSGDSTPPAAPAQRQRLQLSARSTPVASGSSSPTSASSPLPPTSPLSNSVSLSSTSSKPSPFGNAKPIDTAEKDRLVEEKLAADKLIVQAKLALEKEKREIEAKELKASNPKVVTAIFGSAKPVEVNSEREKELESKLAKSGAKAVEKKVSKPNTTKSPETIATPLPAVVKKPIAGKESLRKEGFSYSSIAEAKTTPVAVEEVAKKVENLAV